MRNYSKTVGAMAAASTLVAGYALAEIEGEVHVGYSNMYEFRFVDQGNDLIEAGVDLAADFGAFGVSAGAWYGVWDAPGAAGVAGVNSDELDLYAGVSYSVGDLTLEAGYIYYYFPDTSSDTQDLYVGASYDFPFGLSLASTWYYDFDANNGWYWDSSIGYTIDFNDCLALELGAGIAFADGHGLQASGKPFNLNPGSTADGYQGWYLTAALPWEFREGVTLTPYVKYTDGDGELVTNVEGSRTGQDFFIAGISLAVGF